MVPVFHAVRYSVAVRIIVKGIVQIVFVDIWCDNPIFVIVQKVHDFMVKGRIFVEKRAFICIYVGKDSIVEILASVRNSVAVCVRIGGVGLVGVLCPVQVPVFPLPRVTATVVSTAVIHSVPAVNPAIRYHVSVGVYVPW